ncbi:M14 family zinc carboxypeptidase [Streptomyces sp. NPDC004111]|uniref:M14 family metallopeptidase n=1 Tax=Streptomyces sp. NPDC004111 TaxID=3364690 RepID=UPI0036C00126
MRRRARSILAASSLLIAGVAAVPAAQAQPAGNAAGGGDGISVWNAKVTRAQVPLLLRAGTDAHELSEQVPAKGTATVELVLSAEQAGELRAQGVDISERKIANNARAAAPGDGVYRPYSGKGGLQEEILATAQQNPGITKVVSIGKTVQGKDILALKLTKNAKKSADGSKPATLYMSNQHAREWITPEMTRRLMHHFIGNYGKDKKITRLVDSSEVWFLLSANPDGYDYTHTAPADRNVRLWRKNLRDTNGTGKTDAGDGIDLNRNFAYKWGYDNEGSSPDPTDETFRGPKAMSEPETTALDRFQKRIGFKYAINYHSASELLLYGVGWQVATNTPDDVALKALAGTPDNPAVPGYYPQVSSELYITNGEADGHAGNVNGIKMFTPEMTTCQTASDLDPNDRWNARDCMSGFNFPDDEKLIQQEFAKNVPFALSVAETTLSPDHPVSSVGIDAPDFTIDPFTSSYARDKDQEVNVTARRSVRDKELKYRVNGGKVHDQALRGWDGGEVYGDEDNTYFDDYRAKVKDGKPGDKVEVWFTGVTRAGRPTSSKHFTYTLADRPKAAHLVVAEEGAPATEVQKYVDALRANGRSATVWDVATQGAPHALGVLGHFDSVVHYSGANGPGGETQLQLRAYLNEGGKLVEAGEKAGGTAKLGPADTDDFSQYYLGAYGRVNAPGVTGLAGAGALAGVTTPLAGTPGNPLDTAGAYLVTSDSLPAAQFPQFKSAQAGRYTGVANPYAPFEGSWMASATSNSGNWKRLTRTVDLTGVSAADRPTLKAALNWNTENGFDHALLEAHTAGAEDWTTLPEAGGLTKTTVPTQCEQGFFMEAHPFLTHYLTRGDTSCTPSGTSGQWNSFTGSSGGWKPVSFDLSAYAGKKVELSMSYVTDPSDLGRGVFLDDTRLSVGGADRETEGFETSLGAWAPTAAPAGSPAVTAPWARTGELFQTYAAITTRDTALLGFGLEHVPDAGQRAKILEKALRGIKG